MPLIRTSHALTARSCTAAAKSFPQASPRMPATSSASRRDMQPARYGCLAAEAQVTSLCQLGEQDAQQLDQQQVAS